MVAPLAAVHLRGVSFAHSTAVPVLSDVTLDVGPGAHALVGPNGAGKSTLLDLVDGTRVPDHGQVTVVADGPVVRVRQDPDDLTEPIELFGQRWDGHAVSLRRSLGLDVDDLWRWSTLSPGRRMQWQVAAALAAEPDVLLLDEPTNHVDAGARRVLVDRVAAAGIPLLVVVSHDRAVLDHLTTSTMRIASGTVSQWAGSWSAARPRWEAQDAAARVAHDRARRDESRAAALAAAARSNLSAVESGAAATRRAAGASDPDARGSIGKHNAAAAAKSLASTTRARRGDLARASERVAATRVARRRGGTVRAIGEAAGADVVAGLVADCLTAPDGTPVLVDVDVAMGPRDRVRLAGPNGAGKSTLLGAVVANGTTMGQGGAVGVLDQDTTITVSDRDRLLAVVDRHRVLAIVDRLGADPARVATTARLSPGEARKLALAVLLARPRHLLVLDEPTTHLDIDAIDRLQGALADHVGALLLVTHDDALADAVTTTTWSLEDGHVRIA